MLRKSIHYYRKNQSESTCRLAAGLNSFDHSLRQAAARRSCLRMSVSGLIADQPNIGIPPLLSHHVQAGARDELIDTMSADLRDADTVVIEVLEKVPQLP